MKWDKTNRVFGPGDYYLDLRWYRGRDALSTLRSLISILPAVDPALEIVEVLSNRELLPFEITNLQKVIEEHIAEFLQLIRGDSRLNSPSITFRTGVEGIDLRVVLYIVHDRPPSIRYAGLDFDEEHLHSAGGILSNAKLRTLFRMLVLSLEPDYAVLRRLPTVTEDWHEITRVSIDTTKVPIAVEWMNFFSWDWVHRLGKKKFQHTIEGEVELLPSGYLYFLQEEPFSYLNPEHTARQHRIHRHFQLEKIHKKFAV